MTADLNATPLKMATKQTQDKKSKQNMYIPKPIDLFG